VTSNVQSRTDRPEPNSQHIAAVTQ
jgi:hypothetical protein